MSNNEVSVDFSNFYKMLNRSFWDFFEGKERCRISYGGSGSGKSYSVFQEVLYKIIAEPGHNYLICRKVHATNKVSNFSILQQLIAEMDLEPLFKINKTDMTFTVKATGYMIVLKGLDDIEKIKSFTFPKGILTDIVIEEASEITQKDFDQLNVRLRGRKTGKQKNIPFQITMMLNPIINTHWIKKEFFDKQSYQKEKIKDDGTVVPGMTVRKLKTTYLDNEFIDDEYRAVLEGYKEINYEMYRVYCLGDWGVFGNTIFNNWSFGKSPYKEEDYDAIYNGQDFGFNHFNAIEKIGLKDGVLYSYNELAVQEKTTSEIIELNKEFDILHEGEAVTCDSAEPDRIKEWAQAGYGARPAVKGPGSVKRGIDFLKSQTWIIDQDKCPLLAQEVQTYSWKEDKNGNPTDDPIEIGDDAIKACFYGLEQLSKMKGKPSVLSGKKSDSKKELIEKKYQERLMVKDIIKKQKQDRREQRKKIRAERKKLREKTGE